VKTIGRECAVAQVKCNAKKTQQREIFAVVLSRKQKAICCSVYVLNECKTQIEVPLKKACWRIPLLEGGFYLCGTEAFLGDSLCQEEDVF